MASFDDAFQSALGTRRTSVGNAKSIVDSFKPGEYAKVNAENDARRRKKQQEDEAKRRAQQSTQQPERGKSLLDKAIGLGKEFVETVKTSGQKVVNTGAAVGVGVKGAVKGGVQLASGDNAGANKTLTEAQRRQDELLNKGAGGKGGIISSKEAKSDSFKEGFVKPVARGAAEYSPYFVPTVKGGSLLARTMKTAGINAAQSAGTDALAQKVNTGKVDLKETAKAAAFGGVLGAVDPLARAGAAKLKTEVKSGNTAAKELIKNQQTQDLLTKAKKPINTIPENLWNDAIKAHQPGEVIEPRVLKEDHQAYFNQTKKMQPVPVKSLRFTETPEQLVRSSGRAEELMHGAAAGANQKRDPILVHADEDGIHTILDGNATATAAVKHNWENIPADVVTTKQIPTPEHVEAAKTVVKRAHAENSGFQQAMKETAAAVGTPYHSAAPKTLGRTLTKILDDYEGNPEGIKDTIRGTIELHDPTHVDKVVNSVPEGYKVIAVKNTLDRPNGYRDVKLTVETPNGHKGEVILATPEMLKAKHELGGHALYKEARTTVDAKKLAELEAQMHKLYDEADAAAKARLASSGDSSVPSTKALAGENGTSPGTIKPEMVLPSESSRTILSSTSKNRDVGEDVSSIPSTVADKKPLVNRQKVGNTLTPTQTAHMDTIGGYTHSTHMADEYADMLRTQEQTVKGGQLIGDGQGGKKRISEHSPFYRAFYKENKKAPTKADYLEEAKRELASGKAAYGASEDYLKLVEREGKPIPQAKVNLQLTAGSGKTKTSKLALGVQQQAVRDKLTKSLGDLPQYSKVDMKEQARFATDLVSNDEARAIRIATGQEIPPANILPESVFTAVELKAQATGDIDLLRQLANSSLTGEATAMGQRLRALAERNPDSAVGAMQGLADARKKAFEAKKKGANAAKAVTAEIKAIRAAKPRVEKETFESFVASLAC